MGQMLKVSLSALQSFLLNDALGFRVLVACFNQTHFFLNFGIMDSLPDIWLFGLLIL